MPTLKVYVNNEVIFTILPPNLDSNKENQQANANKNVIIAKHSAGNISGLTFTEFIALPARARVSIGYDNETLGEGFLQLKKL